MKSQQLSLPFGPIHNKHLFSSHWLEHRLSLEPEWDEHRQMAERLLGRLGHLWKRQRNRVERYTEPSLEQAFIQPIFLELGWTLLYQTFLRGRKPDYALFLEEEGLDRALSAGRKTLSFWNHATLVADAKSWTVNLDRPIEINKKREYPPEQIEWYIQRSNRQYGILTNGKLWRLYPHNLSAYQPRFDTYLECNIADLLERWVEAGGDGGQRTFAEDAHLLEDFLKFYLFFSPSSFFTVEDREPLIERAVHGSNEYRLGIGEGLKDRIFEALPICIKGFLSHKPNGLEPEKDLAICKEQSLILLYRLLFVMYGEDRGLLPYRTNKMYRENRSLSRLRDQIAEQIDKIKQGIGQEFDRDSQNLLDDLNFLFDLIDRGGKRYGVPAYNGGLFDPQENVFLREKVLTDRYLARAIDGLSRAPDPEHPDAGLFRVDYRDLSIQHLGHIYENLLELQPQFVKEEMVVVHKSGRQRTEERVVPCSQKLPKGFEQTQTSYKPGEVFLVTQKGERRATGSYYTPNHIVDYIVMQTLGPLCQEVNKNIVTEIKETESQLKRSRGRNRQLLEEKLERLRNDFDDRILRLKILDPAMGSGHFLLRACQYLAEEIATNPNTGDSIADQLQEDESVLTFWKRRIVEHCLYGVDINPLAVELAKVALWLETAAIDQPLTFLDHHLRHGNSLIGGRVSDLGSLPGLEKLPLFEQQVSSRLPILLEGLKQISDRPSNTAVDVKEKIKIYREAVDNVRQPFATAADIWCATFFLDKANQITPDQYKETLESLGIPARHKKLRRNHWFKTAVATAHRPDVAAFHWELEFPEVFFDLSGRREEAGFDAVIGNPPYGSTFGQNETPYFQQKYTLFKRIKDAYTLFIERGISNLCTNGKLSFIVPSAWLGGPDYLQLRSLFLEFYIEKIILLPFDVFPDAYVDTSVFVVSKTRKSSDSIVQTYIYGKKEKISNIDLSNEDYDCISQHEWEKLENKKFVLNSATIRIVENIYSNTNLTFADVIKVKRGVLFDKQLLTNSQSSQNSYSYFEGDVYRYRLNFIAERWVEFDDKMRERPKDLIWFNGDRLLLRRLVNRQQRLMACFAHKTFITNKNLYSLLAISKDINILAVLGILNSRLISYLYINQLTQATKDDFPQVTIKDLKSLPFPTIKRNKAKYNKMTKLVENMLDLHKKLATAKISAEKTRIQRQINTTDQKIDKLVYDLYDLSEEEIEIVKGHSKAN